jgi:hypothetical protein
MKERCTSIYLSLREAHSRSNHTGFAASTDHPGLYSKHPAKQNKPAEENAQRNSFSIMTALVFCHTGQMLASYAWLVIVAKTAPPQTRW